MDNYQVSKEISPEVSFIQEAKRKLRAQFLRDLLHQAPFQGDSVEEINRYYCLDFAPDAFNVLLLKVLPKAKILPEETPGSTLRKIEQLMVTALAPIFHELIAFSDKDRLVCVFNITSSADSQETEFFKIAISRFFLDLCEQREFASIADIIMGEGIPVTDIHNLGRSLETAREALEHGIIYGFNKKYDSNELTSSLGNLMAILTPMRKLALQRSLESINSKEMDRWMIDTFAGGSSYFQDFPGLIYRLSHAIVDLVIGAIESTLPPTEQLTSRAHLIHAEIEKSTTKNEILICLRQNTKVLFELYSQALAEREKLRIVTAKDYIYRHYKQRILLEDVARLVHHNPQYFSVLFKQETGMNFSDFVAAVRIDAAKALLQSNLMTVQAVALEVGYQDPKYFSRVFKKVAKLKPAEYKKLYSRERR